jgi:transcriptional regulator with XRE-family HTH domain
MVDPIRRAQSALTDRLRSARRDAGLTGAEMAQRLGAGWGQPKISKIESGRQMPISDDLLAWAEATSIDGAELLALLDRATHEFRAFREAYPAEGGPSQHQAAYAAAEQAARRIFFYQPTVVHAVLQTPEYARAVLALPGGPADHGATPDQIDLMIAERMRRASILFEPGRELTVLLGEAALLNQVASPTIMRDQVRHIARLMESTPHAYIGVVRFNSCPILPLHGWELRDDIVTIETTAGDLEVADPEEVAQYERWGKLLKDEASTQVPHLERPAAPVSGSR